MPPGLKPQNPTESESAHRIGVLKALSPHCRGIREVDQFQIVIGAQCALES